jgi:histidyl-tRNA synthetase
LYGGDRYLFPLILKYGEEKMSNKTEPRTLAGFMELMPNEQILFEQIKGKIEKTYQKFGFLPLDTPILELSEVLLAKAGGETEKQIYRFEKGDTDLSMRFDLTVPLAKYVAKNYGNLSFPFRRYQIGKVYRGERAQKGRFREFYQCDIDIIGDGELSIINDAELPSVIYNVFKELGFDDFTICINNRKILNGLFESLEQKENAVEILRIIDKIEKIGKEAVIEELEKIKVSKDAINKIISFIEIDGTTDEKIQKLKELNLESETFKLGLEELTQVVKYVRIFGIPEKNFKVDLTIARGLDYYTGTVYETFLNQYRELGSICSGGRYENLAEYYTEKKLPGVGISIGLTRLFYKLNELQLINAKEKSISKVLIVPMLEDLTVPIKLASNLRNQGINTEIFLNDKKLKAKMKYADKLEIPYVIVIGEDEVNSGTIKIKDMKTGEEKECKIENISYEKFIEQ